jgi:hypothetical protein
VIRQTVTAWPLYWPPGWERRERRSRSAFGPSNPYRETQRVLAELGRMGLASRDVVISSDMRMKPDGTAYARQRIADTAVAVWFALKHEERVLACDRWDLVEDNLHAVALHIAAIRGQERWGVGTAAQAFAGFVALPEAATGVAWWDYFGLDRDATEDDVEQQFKRSAKIDHPDAGGRREDWDHLQGMRRT